MVRSLRDELLRAGLVTSEQVSRAERGSRPLSKPARNKAKSKRPGNADRRAARRASGGGPREASERRPAAPIRSPDPDPEEWVKQLNVEIRRILDTEAEKVEGEADTPFHFARRLAAGELAIVGFRGRHHLVPSTTGERVRALRPEVFVFIAGDDDGMEKVEEGYEGYEVPDELLW